MPPGSNSPLLRGERGHHTLHSHTHLQYAPWLAQNNGVWSGSKVLAWLNPLHSPKATLQSGHAGTAGMSTPAASGPQGTEKADCPCFAGLAQHEATSTVFTWHGMQVAMLEIQCNPGSLLRTALIPRVIAPREAYFFSEVGF